MAPRVNGIAVAPHTAAATAAADVLREGGNAVEATVAAAATIAVVYPHMNSIGGDGFWLIAPDGQQPVAIDGCGAAAAAASIAAYRAAGLTSIPDRGGYAANTVAGTVSSWRAALDVVTRYAPTRLPLARLLAPAIEHARDGSDITPSQHHTLKSREHELVGRAAFARTFLPDGAVPEPGQRFRQPQLANTLEQLALRGLDDFYTGDIARSMASDLMDAGSPVRLADLERHRAHPVTPLSLRHSSGTVFNLPAPTQGLVSLLIIGILDRLLPEKIDPLGADFVHYSVEATKIAFAIRDEVITDPAYGHIDYEKLLSAPSLDALAEQVDPAVAAPWSAGGPPSDTVWLGVIDADGLAVSFIQSTYHEFGSGLLLPSTGVLWQNRGSSFSLEPGALNPLTPGRKPFHTLNPGAAQLNDGRKIVFGSMGGDGQPQFMSAVFNRIQRAGQTPAAAVAAPRWLLGRTWGQTSDSLKLESRFPEQTIASLRERGHEIEVLPAFDVGLGHAGALVRDARGELFGGADPRSDGSLAHVTEFDT